MTPQAKETATNGSVPKTPPPPRDFFFLTDQAADNVPNFHYHGQDKSLLYKYILSPLAAFLVNHCTPNWLAPNTITLVGLSLMVTSYCVMWYYSPAFDPTTAMPAWIFLFHSMCMLIYQTLDNMDGKQARRTSSSSPLGLLFDHGCDAANSIFGSAAWILSIGLSLEQDAWMCWALVLGPMALFYVSTWEEYYTGKLILPIMNGPNEGLVLGALTSLMTCLYGRDYWQSTSWYDTVIQPYLLPLLPSAVIQAWIPGSLRNCHVQVFMACVGFVQETCLKMVEVTRAYGIRSMSNMMPFLTLVVASFVIGAYDADVWIRKPRTALHLCSGLFVESCTQLMLDHITNQHYRPMRWVLVPLVLLMVMIVGGLVEAGPWTDEFLVVYTSALWAFLLFKVTIVIHEMCAVLNIFCFDILSTRNPSPRMYETSNGYSKAKHS